MTYDEAVAIRARDLSGATPLHPIVVAEAVWTIREGQGKKAKKSFSAALYHIDQVQVRLLEGELRGVR